MGVIKIIGTPLYQWELGRKISISTSEHTIINKVEFSHDGDTESLVVKPRVENDQMVVDIPNIMLLSGRYIHVYISYSDENLLETVAYDILPVMKRPKPSDYVYTETEVLTWESLDERIKKLEKGTGGADISKEDIQDAVNEYLDNNPVSVNEKDPTVPDWAKQPNPPKQPDTLPNPHKLTFSGAVSAEYDGSKAVEVVIPQGGSGGNASGECRTLIAEYTHTSNKVYQPTAFDEVTGVFTCPNHGITTSEDSAVIIVPNDGVVYDINKIPGKKIKCWLSAIDENSFTINDWDYANDTNAKNVDISAFRFEHSWTFRLQNIPVYPRMEIEIYGKLVCGSWLSFDTSLFSSCILGFANAGTYAAWGRMGYAFGSALGVFKLSSVIEIGKNEITAVRTALRADSAGGSVVFQDWFGRYKLPGNLDTFEINHTYSGANDQGVANGLTVKVFRLD